MGSGFYPQPGWTNIESEPNFAGVELRCDIGDVPLPDHCAEQIYAGHVCEHIPLERLSDVLVEWRRLITGDGVLMVVIPDIEQAIRTNVDRDLLRRICTSDFPPPDGHAWTATAGVMAYFLRESMWAPEIVPMTSVSQPLWPILNQVDWQSAIRCTPR